MTVKSREPNRGRFIALEGGEGAGKSHHARILAERLRAVGIEVVRTREPGGTPGAEDIRGLVLQGALDRWSARTEALLFYAARNDHLERVIRPALKRSAWVICDRFAWSTRAYQAAAGTMSDEDLDALESLVLRPGEPDFYIVLDAPLETTKARRTARNEKFDRMEARDEAFHAAVREAFQRMGQGSPDAIVLPSEGTMEKVASDVWTAVIRRFPEVADPSA